MMTFPYEVSPFSVITLPRNTLTNNQTVEVYIKEAIPLQVYNSEWVFGSCFHLLSIEDQHNYKTRPQIFRNKSRLRTYTNALTFRYFYFIPSVKSSKLLHHSFNEKRIDHLQGTMEALAYLM